MEQMALSPDLHESGMSQHQVGLPHFEQVVMYEPAFGRRGIFGFESAWQCLHLIAPL